MRVSRWGNSLAVRLPHTIVEVLELQAGDSVEIHVAGPRSFEIEKTPLPADVLARLKKYRGRLPEGFTFDRQDVHGRP